MTSHKILHYLYLHHLPLSTVTWSHLWCWIEVSELCVQLWCNMWLNISKSTGCQMTWFWVMVVQIQNISEGQFWEFIVFFSKSTFHCSVTKSLMRLPYLENTMSDFKTFCTKIELKEQPFRKSKKVYFESTSPLYSILMWWVTYCPMVATYITDPGQCPAGSSVTSNFSSCRNREQKEENEWKKDEGGKQVIIMTCPDLKPGAPPIPTTGPVDTSTKLKESDGITAISWQYVLRSSRRSWKSVMTCYWFQTFYFIKVLCNVNA